MCAKVLRTAKNDCWLMRSAYYPNSHLYSSSGILDRWFVWSACYPVTLQVKRYFKWKNEKFMMKNDEKWCLKTQKSDHDPSYQISTKMPWVNFSYRSLHIFQIKRIYPPYTSENSGKSAALECRARIRVCAKLLHTSEPREQRWRIVVFINSRFFIVFSMRQVNLGTDVCKSFAHC